LTDVYPETFSNLLPDLNSLITYKDDFNKNKLNQDTLTNIYDEFEQPSKRRRKDSSSNLKSIAKITQAADMKFGFEEKEKICSAKKS